MNNGALHRFLAEAVWSPTVLIPSKHLRWSAIDDNMACVTLTAHCVTVSLEFRFNATGEVVRIFTPKRWGSFGGRYVQKPWEGRFRDYVSVQGMRVPKHGKVGWYDGIVWEQSGKARFWKPNTTSRADSGHPFFAWAHSMCSTNLSGGAHAS